MYIKKLDTQLEETLDANKEISEKYDISQGVLNEKASVIKKLQEKLANFELKSNDLDDQNRHLKETVKELNKQITEMQAISCQRQSMIGRDL